MTYDNPEFTRVWCSRELHPCFPISPISLFGLGLIIYWFLVHVWGSTNLKPTAEASHILVHHGAVTDHGMPPQAWLTDLKKQLQTDPTKFASMAKKYSQCPSGKAAGGNLGKFSRGTMTPAFDSMVFDSSIPIGTVLGI
jgi:peptidyl-prolyl cis-trans isomerase C